MPPPGSPRRAALRFGVLLLLLAGSFVAVRYTPLRDFLTAERLQLVLADVRGLWWAPLAHVGLVLVLGAVGVPATPFLLAGAAVFGPWWGTLWNFTGLLAASIAGFLLARTLGREFVERIGGGKLKRAEHFLHRRGFMPLIAARFIPVPFSLVNAAAAVVGVRFPKFLAASAIGMLPPVAILTYFAALLLDAASGDRAGIVGRMLAVTATAAVLVFLPVGIRRRARQLRLKSLRAHRAARPRNGTRPLSG